MLLEFRIRVVYVFIGGLVMCLIYWCVVFDFYYVLFSFECLDFFTVVWLFGLLMFLLVSGTVVLLLVFMVFWFQSGLSLFWVTRFWCYFLGCVATGLTFLLTAVEVIVDGWFKLDLLFLFLLVFLLSFVCYVYFYISEGVYFGLRLLVYFFMVVMFSGVGCTLCLVYEFRFLFGCVRVAQR